MRRQVSVGLIRNDDLIIPVQFNDHFYGKVTGISFFKMRTDRLKPHETKLIVKSAVCHIKYFPVKSFSASMQMVAGVFLIRGKIKFISPNII